MKRFIEWIKSVANAIGGKDMVEFVSNIGESKLEVLCDDLHDSQPADHLAAVTGAHAFVKHILPLVEKTENKIDDAFIKSLQDVINQQAGKYNIELV